MWMAGGGICSGMTYGKSDAFGYYVVEDKVSMRDLRATILHQLRLERLTCRYSGRDFRLTDVDGEGLDAIIA